MPRDIYRHLSMLALLMVAAVAITLFTIPAIAAPRTQTSVPNLRLTSDTTITVTVGITDGQVIVVPIDLNIVAQNLRGTASVAVIADVEQQPGLFIGVAPTEPMSATLQLTDASGTVPTPSPTGTSPVASEAGAVSGTHIANVNSNLRAGPGTDFEIVGRVEAGGTVTIIGQNNDGSWLEVEGGSWIAAFLVEPLDDEDSPPAANDAANDQEDSDQEENEQGDSEQSGDEPEDATEADTTEANTTSDAAALAVYLVTIAEIGANSDDAVAELQTMLQNPQPLNPLWREDVAAQLDLLATALDQYLALTPVPGYEDLHAEVTTTAVTCEEAVDDLSAGLDAPSSIDPNATLQVVQACAAQAAYLSAYLETIQ